MVATVGRFHHISQWCHSAWRGWCHHKVNVKYERGSHGCQGLVGGETNLTRSVLRLEGTRHHVARFAYAPPHRACTLSANCRPQGLGDADSQPHASVYASVTLCLFSQSIWKAVKWTKLSANKESIGILSATLTARSSCGNVKQGRDERSVASGMKLLTPHFLSFPVLKLLLSQNVLYMCVGPISRHLRFSPDINHRSTTHAITQTAPCEPFVLPWQRALCLNLCRLFLSKFTFQREYRGRRCYSDWLEFFFFFFFLRERVVIAVSTIAILFFQKCKSHVLKIPLMGIKV